jgi:putative transcriptional regulator
MFKFRHPIWIIAALLCAPIALRGQSVRASDLGVGKLLVARETDRRFAETVILLVEHDSQGALGLTINRRTTEPIAEALRELPGAGGWSEPVYLGGPVQETSVFALLRSRDKQEEMKPVVDEVYWVASKPVLEKVLAAGPAAATVRIYLGYSGWGAGQLENEVRSGSWYIFDGSADLVFDSDPASLWLRLKARTEQRIAYQTIPAK